MPKDMPKVSKHRTAKRGAPKRLGVWIFGARGGLATTIVAGALGIAKGKTETQGLLTETDLCRDLSLAPFKGLVFGGHEIREESLFDSALEIYEQTGTIAYPLLQLLKRDLTKIDKEIEKGCLINAGKTITKLASGKLAKVQPLRKEINRLRREIEDFKQRHKLETVICVNLCSTEPSLKLTSTHKTLEKLDRAIDLDQRTTVRPSTLYAYAAASLGMPFIHFTPSNAALIPAVRELFDKNGAVYMGSDGKTGETLVKSALAPMFKYRNLEVMSWQGYNILGDRDGAVLSDKDNKQSKVDSKDALLSKILGYPLHTHVGIDYVPSLNDLKTAWDFIHFRGFLGYKMSMQFTWQGCDAILAAPIVLDMIRFAELATRRGESGPMEHLSCFFKKPVDVDEHDLHLQWHLLTDYITKATRED